MGCHFNRFIPHLCRQSLKLINVRANALFFDVTTIVINHELEGEEKIVSFLDVFVQKLQPTDFIFISFEGPAPLQKKFKKNSEIFLQKKNHYLFNEKSFLSCIKNKINGDPAWKRPTVICSSSLQPGEAEHKIFSFINTFNKNNRIKPEDNFINFIVTSDFDCAHIALTNNLYNTYIVTNLQGKEDTKNSLPTNKNENSNVGIYDSASSYNFVSIDLLREFLFQYMTKYNEKPDQKTLERVINDFELLSLFIENDFVYNNDFSYEKVYKYSYLFEKGVFLSDGCKINNAVLADFLDYLKINRSYSKKDAKNQIDLINWCFRYYHEECDDFILCCPAPEIGKREITIAEYLRKFPDYQPEFNHFIPTPLQRSIINGYAANFKTPIKLTKYVEKLGKPDLSDSQVIYQIMNGIENEVVPFLTEEEKELNRSHSFFVVDDTNEIEMENNFKFVPKEKKYFIPSLWSHRLDFEINDSNINFIEFEIKERSPITKEEAMEYIGKDVLINWPNICPAKVEKIVLEKEIIEEDLSVRKIPKGFVCEDIENIISNNTGVKYKNKKGIYFFVKPKECISASRNMYVNRSFNKVIPLSMVIDVDSKDPIYRNFEPYELDCKFGESESVFIIPEQTRGTVDKVENGEFEISYEKNTDLGKSPFDLRVMKYYPKEKIAKEFNFSDINVLDYYIEKAGFRADKFNCEKTKIPSTIVTKVKEMIKNEKINVGSYKKTKRSDEHVYETKKFKESDLIWRGNYVREKKHFPFKGARVAFVGASSSIPFGTIGTVFKKHDTSNYAIVEADDAIPFGFGDDERVFRAYIGDLYTLRKV